MTDPSLTAAGRSGSADVCQRGDARYDGRRTSLVWQARKPDRYPRAIWSVQSDEDVVQALAWARSNGVQATIVGGGHSYIGGGLQDDTLVVDLARLTDTTVHAGRRRGSVSPGVRVAAFEKVLDAAGLAFPFGHELNVGVVGYLLGGGLGWNPGAWGGLACANVVAAELILASGERVVADETAHSDLFWAVRGAGPFLSAVVTKLHVRLFPRPAAIRKSTYAFPIEAMDSVTRWLAPAVDDLDHRIELSLTCFSMPPHPDDARPHERCAVTAIAFADTAAEAATMLAGLQRTVPTEKLVSRQDCEPRTFQALLDEVKGDAALRRDVEGVWTADPLGAAAALGRLFASSPSPESVIDIGFRRSSPFTATDACAMSDRGFVFVDSAWVSHREDDRNGQWMHRIRSALAPFETGRYVAETDWITRPGVLARCFPPHALARLKSVASRYDPTGLFRSTSLIAGA